MPGERGRFLIRDAAEGTYYGLELRHLAYGTVREPLTVVRRPRLGSVALTAGPDSGRPDARRRSPDPGSAYESD